MLDFEEVERTIQYAIASGDKDAVHRGLCDLQDAGISDINGTKRIDELIETPCGGT